MINTSLYKKSHVYDFFMKSLGFEGSLDRFLRDIPLEQEGPLKILDAGCGTGLLGLALLRRFPDSELISTDLEPNFLKQTLQNAASQGIECRRIQTGVADISSPCNFITIDGQMLKIADNSLDLICVGAVLGYSKDIRQSLRELVNLLRPGGCLIILEMNETLTGRFVSRRYQYRNIPLVQMIQELEIAGCSVLQHRLNFSHFPAKLTRTAIIANKPRSTCPQDCLAATP